MNQINDLLREEIEREILSLSSLDAGSDEKTKAIDGVTKLYRLRIDEIEAEAKREDARSQIEIEREKLLLESRAKDDDRDFKIAQRADARIDRWINFGLQVGLTGGSWIAYTIWQTRGFIFEETGTICSPWLRNLIAKMPPRLITK